MFDTYIINLENEINNYNKLKTQLENKHYKNIFRFDAIYGKKITNFKPYDKYLIPLFKYCAPFGVLGSGLSHYFILETAYKQYLNNKNKNKYVLVLEDDVIPIHDSDYIEKIISKLDNSIDVLILYTFKVLDKSKKSSKREIIIREPFTFGLPACAYIVNIKSIPKIIDTKLWYYYDSIHFNNPFKTNFTVAYYHKNLFETSDEESHNRSTSANNYLLFKIIDYICSLFGFDNYLFFTLFKVFRIPYINFEITLFDIIYAFTLFVLILTIYIIYKKRIQMKVSK